MKIGWTTRGKHANKAKHFAQSATKFGFECIALNKNTLGDVDIVVSYGNFIPYDVRSDQIWINIHSGCLSRPDYHRISIGNYHCGEYIMDLNRPSDRYEKHNIEIQPWRKNEDGFILVAETSKFNMAVFGLDYDEQVRGVPNLIREHTDREIVMRDRKQRWEEPFSSQVEGAWAVVTWSSNCAVEALIKGVPVFLRARCASSPMCLTDLSRLENPFYPENREQWLKNLSYQQFSVAEIIDGTAFEIIMFSQLRRGISIS